MNDNFTTSTQSFYGGNNNTPNIGRANKKQNWLHNRTVQFDLFFRANPTDIVCTKLVCCSLYSVCMSIKITQTAGLFSFGISCVYGMRKNELI